MPTLALCEATVGHVRSFFQRSHEETAKCNLGEKASGGHQLPCKGMDFIPSYNKFCQASKIFMNAGNSLKDCAYYNNDIMLK